MTFRHIFLSAFAALMLTACGEDEAGQSGKTASAGQAGDPDAKSPLDYTFRLEQGAALDIDALFALMPEDSRPSYESAAFDDALGATVAKNLRVRIDGEEVALIGRAEFYGVDLEAIERIKQAETADLDAPFETVLEQLRLFNIAPSGAGAEDAVFSIGGAEVDRLRVRQGGFEADGDGGGVARAFNRFALDGLYFKDFAMTAQEEGAPIAEFKAPDLRFVDIDGGRLSVIIANNFEYEATQTDASRAALDDTLGSQGLAALGPLKGMFAPEHQRTTVRQFVWRGIDFSELLSYGLKGLEPPLTAKNLIDLGDLKISDSDVFVNDRLAVSAAETTMTAKEFTWYIPSKIEGASKGVVYDFTAYAPETETAVLDILNKHGLNNIAAGSDFTWAWDSKKGDAALESLAEGKKLAKLSLNLDLAGMEIDKIAAAVDAGNDNALALLAKFVGFSLTITDEKLLDAVFDIAALQMGGTGEDLRLSTPALIRLSGAQAAAINPRFPAYVEAVANFVAEGGTLEISATPETPVAFSAISDASNGAPETLPDLLDLKITHEE